MTLHSLLPPTLFRRCLLVLGVALSAGISNKSSYAFDLVETFSGTGSYLANNGQPGFENPGWHVAGSSGTFASNGFGEDVFQVSTQGTGQSGVFRILGEDPFSITAEFSNPQLTTNGFTSAGINVADSPDVVGLTVGRNGSGDYFASMGSTVNGSLTFGGNLAMGSLVERFTLLLDYAPDLVNGGGLFTGYVDVNESGIFNMIATIDGSVYTTEATANRTLFMGAYAFENDTAVELDYLRISGSAVPEPATCSLFAVGLMIATGFRRSRRGTLN